MYAHIAICANLALGITFDSLHEDRGYRKESLGGVRSRAAPGIIDHVPSALNQIRHVTVTVHRTGRQSVSIKTTPVQPMMSRRTAFRGVAAIGLATAVGAAVPGAASATASAESATNVAGQGAFPDTLTLPAGFAPEGIAIGAAPIAYFGNRVSGEIYRANLATGQGSVISPAVGTGSIGLKLDQRGRLFVSGGGAGTGRVISARTGAVLASYQFVTGATFVNDVVLTRSGPWFTDSINQTLYHIPLSRRGELPGADAVVRRPMTGDLVFTAGFNANGIVRTPDGKGLIIVQSNTGLLFRVNPATGVTRTVDLGGELVTNGDGLLLLGRTLYVVRNQNNEVAVVSLNRAGTRGEIVERLTDPRFETPTTVAAVGKRLYLPNARFAVTPAPDTPYTAVAIPRP
jgi:sugar lactone lactonase YvrE